MFYSVFHIVFNLYLLILSKKRSLNRVCKFTCRTILLQDKNAIKGTVNVIKGTVNVIKGTVNVISNDTQSKDGNFRFTPVPLRNLNLIKNVDEAVVILTRKVFTSEFLFC